MKGNDARSWSSCSSKRYHSRNWAVLQRSLPGWDPVAHHHTRSMDRHGWAAWLGVPHNLRLHCLYVRTRSSRAALETIGRFVGGQFFSLAFLPGPTKEFG